jgi:hypothetical protein
VKNADDWNVHPNTLISDVATGKHSLQSPGKRTKIGIHILPHAKKEYVRWEIKTERPITKLKESAPVTQDYKYSMKKFGPQYTFNAVHKPTNQEVAWLTIHKDTKEPVSRVVYIKVSSDHRGKNLGLKLLRLAHTYGKLSRWKLTPDIRYTAPGLGLHLKMQKLGLAKGFEKNRATFGGVSLYPSKQLKYSFSDFKKKIGAGKQ